MRKVTLPQVAWACGSQWFHGTRLAPNEERMASPENPGVNIARSLKQDIITDYREGETTAGTDASALGLKDVTNLGDKASWELRWSMRGV